MHSLNHKEFRWTQFIAKPYSEKAFQLSLTWPLYTIHAIVHWRFISYYAKFFYFLVFISGFVDGVPVFLAKPQTYMNLSGESVSYLSISLKFLEVLNSKVCIFSIIVIHVLAVYFIKLFCVLWYCTPIVLFITNMCSYKLFLFFWYKFVFLLT